MILQINAIIGKIQYGTSKIIINAKQVDPPPNPTLEYKIAVIKKNIDNIVILKIYNDRNYSFTDSNRYKDF